MSAAATGTPDEKSDWTTKTLGEVCEFTGGGTPSKKREDFWCGNIPWVSPKDMKSEVITSSIDQISIEGVEGSAAKLIPKNAILIVVRSGILARTVPTAIAGRELTVNQDLKALLPSDCIAPRFLAYFLKAVEPVLLRKVTKGATVHRLSTDNLKTLPIPFPPLDEQKRIVAVLDQAFAALDRARVNAEANLADATALERRVVQANLTPTCHDSWQTCKLGKVLTVLSGFAFKSSEYTEEGHFLIRIANVQDGEISLHRPKFVNLNNKTSKFELAEGDILTSLTGNIGRVAVMGEEHLPAALNQRVAKLVPTDGAVSREFLLQFLCSDLFGGPLREKGRGAAQQNVSPNEIKNIDISFPDKLEQRKIVESILSAQEACSQLRQHYHELISDIDELRQSLLQKAFAGELT